MFLLHLFHKIQSKARFLGSQGYELFIVIGNPHFFGQALADEAAAGSMLTRDGDDDMLHIPSLPVWIAGSTCYCNYTAFS